MTLYEVPIVIMTVARAEPYLDLTLASLSPRQPITLMVGSPDRDYLLPHGENPLLRISVPGPEEYSPMVGLGVCERAAWNYWRCLGAGEGSPRLLVFEDDVRFAKGWEARLQASMARIERDHADYILSLYYPGPKQPGGPGHFIPYSADQFFGTQGVLFAGHALGGYRDYLEERGVRRWTMPYDLLLGRFAAAHSIPIFAAMPSLIQHIGALTTGQSSEFHRATSFVERLD